MLLHSLDTNELLGRNVVYFDSLVVPRVYVGRIEQVKQSSFEELTTSGLLADVTLLLADRHEYMADLFFQTYLYRNPEPLVPGLMYAWPDTLPPQLFQQLKRPGHIITLQLKTSVKIIMMTSADFDMD